MDKKYINIIINVILYIKEDLTIFVEVGIKALSYCDLL